MTHHNVVIGIDFGGTKTAVAVCDPAGRKLGRVVTGSLGELGAQLSFQHGLQTARALLQKTAPGADVAAVGVATFGIPFEDRVELAPTIPGWGDLALGAELRAAFPGSRIAMATDTKAAGAAEARWGSLAGCDPAIYVNLGTGLAAAVVTGGRVLAGRNGAAGEIGYSVRGWRDVGVPETRRHILEDVVSGAGLQRRASEPGRTVTAAEVFAGARPATRRWPGWSASSSTSSPSTSSISRSRSILRASPSAEGSPGRGTLSSRASPRRCDPASPFRLS